MINRIHQCIVVDSVPVALHIPFQVDFRQSYKGFISGAAQRIVSPRVVKLLLCAYYYYYYFIYLNSLLLLLLLLRHIFKRPITITITVNGNIWGAYYYYYYYFSKH